MKYNIGDKFVIEIMDVEEDDPEIPYCMNDNQWFFESTVEKLQKYVEPKSVVWRDGATEKWEPMCASDKEDGFRWKAKNNPTRSIYWSADSDITDTEWWSHVLWLPTSEFPMPEVPEPEIAKCPFCGGECISQYDKYVTPVMRYIECPKCSYMSAECDTEKEARDKHNSLCQKLK